MILLTKGVPLWFWADEWRDSSVDMPLCYLGNASPTGAEPFGWMGRSNAFYSQDQSFEAFRPSNSNQMMTSFPSFTDLCMMDSGIMLAGAQTGLIFRKSRGAWSGVGDRNGAFSATDIVSITSLGNTAWATQATYSRWATYADGGRILRSTDQGVTWSEARAAELEYGFARHCVCRRRYRLGGRHARRKAADPGFHQRRRLRLDAGRFVLALAPRWQADRDCLRPGCGARVR